MLQLLSTRLIFMEISRTYICLKRDLEPKHGGEVVRKSCQEIIRTIKM